MHTERIQGNETGIIKYVPRIRRIKFIWEKYILIY